MSKEKLIIETVTVVGMLVAMAGLVAHCGQPVSELPVETAAGSLYLAEQLACIDKAETRAAAQGCINAVRARWAAAQLDGGTQ